MSLFDGINPRDRSSRSKSSVVNSPSLSLSKKANSSLSSVAIKKVELLHFREDSKLRKMTDEWIYNEVVLD